MAFEVERVRVGSHRVPILVNTETRLPDISTALWAEHLSGHLGFNSLVSYLRDIALVYSWAQERHIDLDRQFAALVGLSRSQIRSLSQYLGWQKLDRTLECAPSTATRRIIAAKQFFEFQMDRYLDRCGTDYFRFHAGQRHKERMNREFSRAMSDAGEIEASTKFTSSVSTEVLDLLSLVLHPLSELNPFRGQPLRIRNFAIFKAALETWPRRSELVLLELPDLNLSALPSIKYIRKPAWLLEQRNDGASMKTKGREFPISQSLAKLFSTYLRDSRPQFLSATLSNSVFLSERDGLRLSVRSINHIFSAAARACFAATGARVTLHPHMFRVTGATDFRRRFVARNAEPASVLHRGELEDILTYAGGWSRNSQMPTRYTREAIIERLNTHIRKADTSK